MASNKIQPIAHIREMPDGSLETDDLKDHLTRVAEKATQFADEFGNGDWAMAAGLLHDLGKYNPQWQENITQNKRRLVKHGKWKRLIIQLQERFTQF
jgi:CRISPR-associated endonuclease/helicase Cas3